MCAIQLEAYGRLRVPPPPPLPTLLLLPPSTVVCRALACFCQPAPAYWPVLRRPAPSVAHLPCCVRYEGNTLARHLWAAKTLDLGFAGLLEGLEHPLRAQRPAISFSFASHKHKKTPQPPSKAHTSIYTARRDLPSTEARPAGGCHTDTALWHHSLHLRPPRRWR